MSISFGHATIFLQSAGMPAIQSFNFNKSFPSVHSIHTGIAIPLIGTLDRRTFFFWGSSSIDLAVLVVGILGFIYGTWNVSVAAGAVAILVQVLFKLSLGPTTYVIVAKSPSNRIRA
ncbi:Maltose permease MAL31-like protein [Paramyrothecium foliicola]|nr:Maltose permease MAL31-like protein [Paramyrothecium foliicola]